MTGRVIAGREEIQGVVARLGAELSAAYGDDVVLVASLKGSVLFLADLIRTMTITPVVDFLAVTSYAEDTGRVRIAKDLDLDITDRDVVLVESVIDTGLTLSYLLRELTGRGPRSLEVCALLDKTARRVVPVEARWVGLATDAHYVVGYGLDHRERYRNVALLAEADPHRLAEDPDRLLEALYPGA